MRVALVTGASRGIGAAVAEELARRGLHVVITARTQGGLEAVDDRIRAAGGTATLLPLDLLDCGKVDAIGPSLRARFGRLDVLVSNAGTLGRLTPLGDLPPGDWAEVVGVNLSAAWRLIRGCGPLLLAAEAGRAVFVTGAMPPTAYWGAYGATKAALDHLVQTWAAETRLSRLVIHRFHPERVATRLRAAAMPGLDPASLVQPADLAPGIADLCSAEPIGSGGTIKA